MHKPKTKATVYGKEAPRSGLASHDTAGDAGLGRRVSEDVAQGWQLTVNIGRTSVGQRHQADCEKARGREGKESKPAESLGRYGGGA